MLTRQPIFLIGGYLSGSLMPRGPVCVHSGSVREAMSSEPKFTERDQQGHMWVTQGLEDLGRANLESRIYLFFL